MLLLFSSHRHWIIILTSAIGGGPGFIRQPGQAIGFRFGGAVEATGALLPSCRGRT